MKAGDLKSQRSIFERLHSALLLDIVNLTGYDLHSAKRDSRYFENRLQSEGLAFATQTIPSLGKALDRAMLTGTFQCPTNFRVRRGTKLPLYLGGLFKRVFDAGGTILEDACVDTIRVLRQVAFVFYKYELPYDQAVKDRFLQEFIDDDASVGYETNVEIMSTIYYAKDFINEVLKDFKHESPLLKNGPGVTANNCSNWEKYRPTVFYEELDGLYSYAEAYYYNNKHLFDCWDSFYNLPFGDGGTALLMMVPKDSRGPRIISAEPSEKMAYQQALRAPLYHYIENNVITAGQVNFTDQTINGELALEASLSGLNATLDLRKASDLVSYMLIEDLYDETTLWPWIRDSRSKAINTPGGTVHLKKYAPMGNALTFPIQALTFYALIVGRMIANGVPRRKAARSVYVYGDDIIVPTDQVAESMDVLTSVGLQINTDKSCYSGHFRESCGVDAFKGENITPIKLKKVFTHDSTDVTLLTAWTDYSNNFFESGYWHASNVMKTLVEKTYGEQPLVTPNSPLIGFTTWSSDHVREANHNKLKYNPLLQRYEVRGIQPLGRSTERNRDRGWERLNRFAWDASPTRDEPFSTGTFTARHTVIKKYVVEDVDRI